MTLLTVMIFESPYGREKPYTALRFALTALNDGHKVTVILIQEGIFVALKNQEPVEYPNLKEYLEMAIEEGLEIIVCGVCCKSRGIKQEDLIDGATIVGMHEIVDACSKSDNTITF
ncbi:MAG: DsrE/DsrF/TusD sulfur relay family protein [Candidatus Helarchaeota archaeon]